MISVQITKRKVDGRSPFFVPLLSLINFVREPLILKERRIVVMHY